MLRRGFKSEGERIATEARALAGLPARAPLPARKLAKKLEVIVVGPKEIPGLPDTIATQMLAQFANRWSAFTFKEGGQSYIVHNTAHAPARQESDLMHELAHIWCKHAPGRIEPPGNLPFATRTYDPDQEEEASWLGACLQIPREALMWFVQRGFTNDLIAEHFGASEEMVRFRRNVTGIDAQIARLSAWRNSKVRSV